MTATTTEATVIDRGWAAYHNAVNAMWPESIRKHIGGAATDLYDALELYGDILSEVTHPAAHWDDLAYEDDAYAMALERAAQAVSEWTDELIRVFPAAGDVFAGLNGSAA